MDAMVEDITHFNSQLLLLASDPNLGERVLQLLEAPPEIIRRIGNATSRGIGTAIRCGIPLVTFTSAMEEMDLGRGRRGGGIPVGEVPLKLREVTRFAVQLAHRLVLVDPTLAQLEFELTRGSAERLARMSVVNVIDLCRRYGTVIRLRKANEPHLWDRLLIGDRCSGPRALQISQQAALLSLYTR